MSHKACHWLEDLPAHYCHSGAFRVLFHLCCAHNAKVSPYEACFPSQSTLREATGLSNGGLNKCLNELEKAGMFWRRRTKKPNGTKGPTYYILRFDFKDAPQPTPLSGVPANSTPVTKPTPLWEPNQLHPSGDKPVREPVIEPVSGDTHISLFQKFMEISPRGGNERQTEALFDSLVADGVSPLTLVLAVQAYADENKGNQAQYIRYSENFLADDFWRRFEGREQGSDLRANEDAQKIINHNAKKDGPLAFSPVLAGALIANGLVTSNQCREAGIQI